MTEFSTRRISRGDVQSRCDRQFVAFTLIELLVVLAILSILVSLALAGILSTRTTGRIAKTSSTIRKISEIILPYYEQYETRRVRIPNTSTTSRGLISQVRSIGLRRLIATELPERTSDVMNPSALFYRSLNPAGVDFTETSPVVRRYRSILSQYSDLTQIKSEDLLHMIVTRGPVADPDVIAHFRPDEIADRNGNGMLEFVDGWGEPIKFKRWAIGFSSPVQPIDGELSSRDVRFSPNGHRLVPLVFSAGPDQTFDILDIDAAYDLWDFDPFRLALSADGQRTPTGVVGETALVSSAPSAGVTTFVAHRLAGSGVPGAFQTIGSERSEGGASLGSRDNIHNHDMTR